ncbi:disease resistance RPP13 protein [Salix suchowensis]|nr:disease resistance RPP13 protein [Salix suchowensis]
MVLVIGEPILSASISHIINQLTSQELLKFASRKKIHSNIRKLETNLHMIGAVLDDAEEKQMGSHAVKLWLEQVRDLVYDIEDLLDGVLIELTKERRARSSKARSAIPRLLISLNPATLLLTNKMDSQIKSITARLQEIVQKKNYLDLRENVSGGELKMDLSYVCGRDNDKEEILKFLFSDQRCDEYGIGVIPIVGMGGVGKTTLAQLVYNDEKVDTFFDLKVWCCVSEDFDVVRVTRTILEAVSGSYDAKDLNLLQLRLREKLAGKKFLIVLDDVWNENYDNWTVLRRPFQLTSPGSRIIVTTPNQDVALMMSAFPSYHLKELSFDDSLSLFAKHAVGRPNSNDLPDLLEIGQQIVQRCRGLPMAVKTLGGLLRTKPSVDEWENVLNSKMWDISEHKGGIVPALRLSYYHLPSHLKQLFVFCSIFPKDYEFYKDDLVLLWMAEGFLPDAGGEKRMEELYSCFNELLSRSFFQRSSSNEQRYLMHHLISDLAQSVAGETCVNLNDKQEYNRIFPDLEKTRHMSFTRRKYEVLQRFKDLGKLKRLRTFIAFRLHSSPWGAYCYLSNNVLHEALLKLRHLRVLSLSGYCITELPNSIGDLKKLPVAESVSKLINLQTLKLCGCRKLQKLPQGTGILINLCHLDITGTDNLIEMPSWMGNLTGLQTLSKFIVGKKEGCGIEELKGLKNLQGRLSIMALHNVIDARRAAHANLMGKHNLDELELKWSESDLEGEVIKHHMPVLNSLQPHANLKELKISFFGGTEFPSWVGHPSFSEIVHLELSCCRKCTELPPLGRLPSLRDLCIQGLDAVEIVGPGFYGVGSSVKPFQSLKTLKFEDMREWKSWWSSAGVDEEEFPSLSELTFCLPSCVKITIAKCPMLVDSDEKLPVLSELELEECDGVTLEYMFHKSSPTTLKLGSMSKLTCLTGHFLQSLGALKVLMISDFPNLTSLWEKGTGLENFEHPQFVSSTEIGMPSTHKSSKLSGCDKLELLPNHKVHMLLSLEDLCIETCPNLVSIPEAGLLSSLRHLVLRDCKALRSLPDGISNCPLEDLEIEECPLLKCFPGGMLPATLKSLKIRYCREFKSLPEGLMHNENGPDTLCHFHHLEIIGCPSLKSFPDGKLPTRLKTLKIWDCSQLKPLKEEMLHDDMSLQYLAISDREALSSFPECLSTFMHLTEINSSNCSALTFFPGVGLSLASLRALTIYNCKNLKSLPYEMQKLTSLQKLTICSCPALESFPNGDLPPNLTSLVIWDCDGIDGCLSNWNLQSLACLRDFSIAGQCFLDTVSFPDEKCLLPTTLTSIWIARLPNLESLSMQLRSLAFLEELEIADCPKLKSLPRECLPPALGRLCIRNCPLMTKRCSKEKGVYWPLISHIPCVEINDGNAIVL